VDRSNNFVESVTRSPVIWGCLGVGAFYGLIHSGLVNSQLVNRYFASHPVEYLATVMFFVGFSSLLVKLVDVVSQLQGLSEPLLGPVGRGGESVSNCSELLGKLERQDRVSQSSYLVRRLRETIEYVRRNDSADGMDEQLRYLADLDVGRANSSYALVRVIIWAIPILGFLGTVIGITLAIANLSPDALEDSLPEVTAGLGVAFDTTALALGLSIVLMFGQFLVDRVETTLLDRVDQRAERELIGRFERIPEGPSGQMKAVGQMAEQVVRVVEDLVRLQTELWRGTIQKSEERWAGMANESGRQLQAALGGALNEGLKSHAQQVAVIEKEAASENRRHWENVQDALLRGAEANIALQSSMQTQAELLEKAIAASGEIAGLENSLNRNLAALAGSKNFEQTVMSLSAAIHLLNSRITSDATGSTAVNLGSGHAA